MSVLDEIEDFATCDFRVVKPWKVFSGRSVRDDKCRNGHPYTKESTKFIRKAGKIRRRCLICHRAYLESKKKDL